MGDIGWIMRFAISPPGAKTMREDVWINNNKLGLQMLSQSKIHIPACIKGDFTRAYGESSTYRRLSIIR